ncbi:MAG TPA: hypothetical protein VHB77_13305 [Planctomycetaceae bacterium]|nr:hypothetical protein [Planctomycetaceae bacterium]
MKAQEHHFQIGDLVKMPSGGPLMQVRAIRPTLVQCAWRSGEITHLAYFHSSLIVPAEAGQNDR